MITYRPFWETMRRRGESTYSLIKVHHVSSGTLDRLRKNRPITTVTIDDLCAILRCGVSDIVEYIATDNPLGQEDQ